MNIVIKWVLTLALGVPKYFRNLPKLIGIFYTCSVQELNMVPAYQMLQDPTGIQATQ